ncbi:MAG: InlB B-repeat-containing protein, partial [Spirochaetaceae bacterium]|nr:InlB B-repeat-containing protein [Spirochaetaceae bacterium]
MGSISLLAWRKAYMLEFVDNDAVVDTFTFAIPPESEDFAFPQRLSETKTFGGSVFDDYGNDTYRITLSGTTVNEDKKLIYKGKKAPQYLTGTQEIFELQKLIKKWNDGKKNKGSFSGWAVGFLKSLATQEDTTNRKVYLYDLSKMSLLQIAAGTASRNYWRVFIKELKIKRDKTNKIAYKYTLDMLAVEDSQKKAGGLFSDFASQIETLTKAVDTVNTVLTATQLVTQGFKQTNEAIEKMNKRLFKQDDNGSFDVLAGADTVSRILGVDSTAIYNDVKNVQDGFSALKEAIEAMQANDNEDQKSSKVVSAEKFRVYFNSNGGSNVESQLIAYCKSATKPDDPIREYYTFAGWYSDSTLETEYDFDSEITASIVLYAKWILAVAEVRFNSLGGSNVPIQYVKTGEKATEPAIPKREGYAFNYWCTDSTLTNEFDFNTPINNNIVLYAKWGLMCLVKFVSNGGSDVEEQTVSIGGKVIYPITPTKENYEFSAWCTDNDLTEVFDFSTSIHQNITLYARYTQIYNDVYFDSMGGSSVASQKVKIGSKATLPEAPTKDGYTFNYWCTDSACTNQFNFLTTPINAPLTLYAKWSTAYFDV